MKVQILVVDDEPEIRAMLSRHYRYLGYEVDTAAHGREALDLLALAKTDIVITDIKMPVMDGIELLRAVRRDYPMIHTIMITGYVTMENVFACMRHGADTLVFKPLEDLTLLDQAIVNAVDSVKHWTNLLKELQGMKPSLNRVKS
jgi:CheY-like chemotaxis protein